MWISYLNQKVIVECKAGGAPFECTVREISDGGQMVRLEQGFSSRWVNANEFKVADTVQLNERVLLNEVGSLDDRQLIR
tara:strand:+ start:5476 stop:5712 length:237 start_codon:yes stop_codon:yes gene_type:complete